MSTGVTMKIRQVVLRRAGKCCEICGRPLDGFFYSLQHRRARGMGGSKLPDTNLPVNLLAVCGTATTPDRCHQPIEANPDWALENGYRVRQGQDPSLVPVMTRNGWMLLLVDGSTMAVQPA